MSELLSALYVCRNIIHSHFYAKKWGHGNLQQKTLKRKMILLNVGAFGAGGPLPKNSERKTELISNTIECYPSGQAFSPGKNGPDGP